MAKASKKATESKPKNITIKTTMTADELFMAAINTPIKKKDKPKS